MKKITKIINSKVYLYIDLITFFIMMLAAVVSMYTLCYRQAISTSDANWVSDIGAYIEEILGINEKYSFPYPLMFDIAKIINCFTATPQKAMAIAVTSFNLLSIIIVKIVLEKKTGTKLLSTIATICMFFLSMIYGKCFEMVGIRNIYVGVYSPNPWQNQTYMAARPFMVLAFVFGALTLDAYEKELATDFRIHKNQILKYICFGMSLLFATLAKPSYTLIHMGAAGIIMLYRLVKNRFNTFRQTLLLGCCYLPTIIALLYQFSGVFMGKSSSGKENGVGIGILQVWSYYTDNIPVAIILAAAFPLLVLMLHWKQLKTNTLFRFSWQVYLIGLAMWCIFIEKGDRLYHGNFQWGYHCGLFLVFFVSLIILLQDTNNIFQSRQAKAWIALVSQWLLLGVHTIMGLWYFYMLTVFGVNYF